MSRPTINRPESIEKIQNEDVKTVRSSSLKPVYDYIKSDASIFCKLIGDIRVDKINYKPSTDIKPILLADRKQINTCMSVLSEYLSCREINPEYKCEEIRDFLLIIKCI